MDKDENEIGFTFSWILIIIMIIFLFWLIKNPSPPKTDREIYNCEKLQNSSDYPIDCS